MSRGHPPFHPWPYWMIDVLHGIMVLNSGKTRHFYSLLNLIIKIMI